MEWYIRFKKGSDSNKWLKSYYYQIKYVENYIKYGIHPNTDIKLTFTEHIKNTDTNTIYLVYLNEYGEKVEMLFETPEKIAFINRITDTKMI
jgi:hypothetical protein